MCNKNKGLKRYLCPIKYESLINGNALKTILYPSSNPGTDVSRCEYIILEYIDDGTLNVKVLIGKLLFS